MDYGKAGSKQTHVKTMARLEHSEEKLVKNAVILREFQVAFFAMGRLASFPWAVSINH